MSKLDKELLKIVTYSSDEGTSGYLITDEQLAKIKSVILEALKAEMPKEDYTHNVYAEGYNQALSGCLEVCNKLLGDRDE